MARTTFRFRLSRLLDVRVMREKQAQQELLARRQQVTIEEQRLAKLEAEEQQLRADQRVPFQRGEDLYRFEMRRHFLEQAIKQSLTDQTAQKQRISDAQARVLEQIEVVKQRGIEVKALEKLETKQREEHRLDQLREEGLFMDDLAGQGYMRRRTIAAEDAADDAAFAEAERARSQERPA
jgi:flagellar export protein FliJ